MSGIVELGRKAFRGVWLAFRIVRDLVAYAIAVGVLFYVPWLMATLAWASPVTGELADKLAWVVLLWCLWYLFLGVVVTPLWYQSWANAALLLNDLLTLYRRIAGWRGRS